MKALSILLPVLMGFLVAFRAYQPKWSVSQVLFMCVSAPAIGIAITSALFFTWSLILRPNLGHFWYLLIEISICAALFASIWVQGNHSKSIYQINQYIRGVFSSLKSQVNISGKDLKNILFSVALASVFTLFLINFLDDWYTLTVKAPHGDWDAWAIWNLRARFFYAGENWRDGFSSIILWSHPDYPLLLPAFIGRTWQLLGSRTTWVPALTGLYFQLLILAAIVTRVSDLRNRATGLIAGLFTLAILQESLLYRQYADIPLAGYILLANIWLYQFDTQKHKSIFTAVMAGLAMGAAIWTKNEGLAFLLAFLLVEVATRLWKEDTQAKTGSFWGRFLLGIAPFLFVWILLKITLAPPNDVLNTITPVSIFSKLVDPRRYSLILSGIFEYFLANWSLIIPLIPLLLVFRFLFGSKQTQQEKTAIRKMIMRLCLLAAIYFGIYLITPNPLQWHIETSMDRLFMHILPGGVFIIFSRVQKIQFDQTNEGNDT